MQKENKKREYTWAVIISIIGSASLAFLSCPSCHEDIEKYFKYTLFSTVIWLLLWIGNSEMNDYLSLRISWIKAPIKRLLTGIIGTILFTIMAVLLVLKAFELGLSFQFNNYIEVIIPSLIITFFISLFFHGRGFLIEWRRSAIAAERYQKESMTATYENLKNQVNPHFLFNSLNALTSLVHEDQEKAVKFIKQLSEVYRYVLDSRNKEVVSIEEELKFLDSYVFLQQIRFGDKLKIKNSLNNIVGNLPPLALQMLLENAIKHNVVSQEYPLTIDLYQEDKLLVVKNNLQVKNVISENAIGVGLENIKKRYEFLTNTPMEIIKSEDNFVVKLPILVEA